RQFSYPDVAEAERFALVAVRLQFDRRPVKLFVKGLADIARLAFQFKMILYNYSIEEHGRVRRRLHRSIIVEGRSGPDDIVDLPLSRLARRICQWDRLLVKAARHAIYVGLIVVGIKDLQFVSGIAGTCGRQEQA